MKFGENLDKFKASLNLKQNNTPHTSLCTEKRIQKDQHLPGLEATLFGFFNIKDSLQLKFSCETHQSSRGQETWGLTRALQQPEPELRCSSHICPVNFRCSLQKYVQHQKDRDGHCFVS